MVYVSLKAARWYVKEKWIYEGARGDPPTEADAKLKWFNWLYWIPSSPQELASFKNQFPYEYAKDIYYGGTAWDRRPWRATIGPHTYRI